MTKPTILTVDDDPMVSQAITRDLRSRYGADYRIVRAASGAEGARGAGRAGPARPAGGAGRHRPADAGDDRHRDARAGAQPACPSAKLLLLTAYADTDVAIRAINDIGLDYYLLKPWDPPEDRLYPVIDDLLGDWQRAHPDRQLGRPGGRAPLVGTQPRGQDVPGAQPRAVPLARHRARRGGAPARRSSRGAEPDDLPLVLVPDGEPLRSPSDPRPGRCPRPADPRRSSRCTTCASSAAVRPAWRPRSTPRPRGCAPSWSSGRHRAVRPGQSASIENYLGFPKGLSGADLTHRAVAQAARFGAEMVLARDVVGVREPRARCGRCASATAARSRRVPCSSPPACPTGGSRRPGSRSSRAAASTTARPPAKRSSARATTCTSWAPRTRPGRPR